MKRLPAILTCFFLLAPRVCAGGAGTTAASFLKIDPSAREASLAGAAVALDDDGASLINYNPALLAAAQYKQLSFTHTGWLSGTQLESLSYAHPYGEKLSFGAGINYLHTPDVPKTDSSGNLLGSSFNSADGVFSLGVAGRMTENIYLGGALKTIRQALDDRSAMAIAGDAGVLLRHGVFTLGLAVANLGSQVKLYEQESPLPLTYRVGASAKAGRNFTLFGEVDKSADTVAVGRLAAEYAVAGIITPNDRYALRLGYRTATSLDAGPGFTAGAGMKLRRFALDYCFVPMGDLGNTNRISVSVGFGKTRAEETGTGITPASTPSSDNNAYKPRLKDPYTYLRDSKLESDKPDAPDDPFSTADKARTRLPQKSRVSPKVKKPPEETSAGKSTLIMP